MSDELFCPLHGPYARSLGRCPYCSQGDRPPAPASLGEDETAARPRGGSPSPVVGDDDETIPPGAPGPGRSPASSAGGDDETLPPVRRAAGGGRPAAFDEDETQLPERRKKRFLDDVGDEDIDVTVIDREDTSMLGWLIVKSSPFMRRGQILKIRSGAIYGRSPKKADVVVDDEKVSGLHARIQLKDDRFLLIDMGSANGTFLNGQEITGTTALKENDEIRLGSTTFVLKVLGAKVEGS